MTAARQPGLTLHLLPQDFTILRLAANAPPPDWAFRGGIWSMSNTHPELTLVVEASSLPADSTAERSEGWRCLRIGQVFDFSVPGILASVLSPLAAADVGIFASSTFSTDYIWISIRDVPQALSALTKAGHTVHEET